MPRITSASRAVPAYCVQQNQVRNAIKAIFQDRIADLHEKMALFENSRIDQRYLVRPLAWYGESHKPGECNRIYIEEGVSLLHKAAESCLEKSGVRADAIDYVISVSSTGMATPSLESRIFTRLGLRQDAGRIPVWGLGCAAGAAGLALAANLCRAKPDARVLLLALECCSLTFRKDDASLKNLVGTALFGDGAAAALIAGDDVRAVGPRIVASCSQLFPDSERVMGWDFDDDGMQLVLSPDLPRLIETELTTLVDDFLGQYDLRRDNLEHYILHPGGARVIAACRQALDLNGAELRLSEESLRQYGNVSSVSVLMILEDWLATRPERQPGYGLLGAFGPGFSAELLLLET